MNRVVNRPIALVHSQWFWGAVLFILDQRNSLIQSALSWHVPVKCKVFLGMLKNMYTPFPSLQLVFLCDTSILNKEQLNRMYPECLNGIGKFKNYEHHMKLKGNTKSVVHPVRKIALALGGNLEKELQNMDQGMIAPVGDGDSDLVNLFIIRENPVCRLCMCLDPKDPNKVIKTEHQPVPTIDITPSYRVLHAGCCIELVECSTCHGITSHDNIQPMHTHTQR